MSYILSVYSKLAFKEYILPSINNADYDITIQRKSFSLRQDIGLNLEVLNNQWFIKESDDYMIGNEVVRKQRMAIENNAVLQLVTKWREPCTIIIKETKSTFKAYCKYRLDNIRSLTIGKDQGNDIRYDFLGMVSRIHARIIRGSEGFYIENSSSNGIYVNSNRINDSVLLEFGAFINIMGLHMVFLGNMLAIELSENVRIQNNELIKLTNEIGEDPSRYIIQNREMLYHRAPRNYERVEDGVIEIEEPPQLQKTKEQSVLQTIAPSLTMMLPMLLGAFLMIYSYSSMGRESSPMMYSGLVMSVSSATVSVTWALVNIRRKKKEEKEAEEHRFNAYSDYLVEKSEEIKEKYKETERKMCVTYPDVVACLNYDENKGLLWSRNYSHDDFLKHRLGIGEIPFQVDIQVPKKRFRLFKDELSEKPTFLKSNFRTLYNVPITVDLLKNRLIGVLGGENGKINAIQVAKLLAAQLATNNCYTDVKLGFIYNESDSSDNGSWEFAKWLPHVWSEDHNTRYIASSVQEGREVLYEIARILRARTNGEEYVRKKTAIPKPYYVFFVSDISMLEGELFSKYVFDDNTEIGLTTVLLAESAEELPNECEFIIENSSEFKGMYRVNDGKEQRQKIQFDELQEGLFEKFARHIAPLRVMEMEEGGEIPNSITFFEMLNINRIEQYPVAENWAKCKVYENIRGLLGKKAGGNDCYLDLHEKYHGPHGLVAGTTGSGKSETLQTYILSLAVNYSPDDIGFFIIDSTFPPIKQA